MTKPNQNHRDPSFVSRSGLSARLIHADRWTCLSRCHAPVLALALLLLPGCIVVPTPEHGLLSGRDKIDESELSFMKVGSTTREDVLLRFGEPSEARNDQRILIYHWAVVQGYYAWAVADRGVGAGGGGPIPKDYLLMLEFGEDGRLKRFERTTPDWFESVDKRVARWTASTIGAKK